MSRGTLIHAAIFLTLLLVIGCSRSPVNPVTTTDTEPETILTVNQIDNGESNHQLLGMWTAEFDPDSLTLSTKLNRSVDAHYDVTYWLFPLMEIIAFDPVTRILTVDVTIFNAYYVNGFDVRLILFDPGYGVLQNADGWTTLYDIPGGETINPFKAYAKSEMHRKFAARTSQTETLEIYFPYGSCFISYAIDASYPSNCEEPYEITGFIQNTLYDMPGSITMASVEVYDWQDDVVSVELNCPIVTGQDWVSFYDTAPDLWELVLENVNGAPVGEYDALIKATTASRFTVNELYVWVTICVSPKIPNWGGIEADDCYEIAIDNSGNIYVSGYFQDVVDFDPDCGIDLHTSNGGWDAFLCKFNSYMTFQWATTWGGPYNDTGSGLVIDSSGNAIVGFNWRNSLNWDAGLIKFDGNGSMIWEKTWGGSGTDAMGELILDNYGNIYVTGWFENTVDFDPDPFNEFWLYSNGFEDLYLSKFNSNGDFINAIPIGGGAYDEARDIAFDGYGNILFTGGYGGTVDFNQNGSPPDLHTSEGGYDVFLGKYDTNFNFIWANTWGSPNSDAGNCINFDNAGNIYITGWFGEPGVDFDPDPFDDDFQASLGKTDAFLSKFLPNGDYVWGKTWGGSDDESGTAILLDGSSYVYIVGQFWGTADFDPAGGSPLASLGHYDAFLSKLDLNGNFVSACRWGGPISDVAYDFDWDWSGTTVYITGHFMETADLNPGPPTDWITSKGQTDMYITSVLNP